MHLRERALVVPTEDAGLCHGRSVPFPEDRGSSDKSPGARIIDQTYSLTLRLPASCPAGARRGRALLLRLVILPAAEKQAKPAMFMVNALLSRRR
jgi:hypothetical protein